jgi:hypothetical protein
MIDLHPGGLIRISEQLAVRASQAGELRVLRLSGPRHTPLLTARLDGREPWRWTPPAAGGYLLRFAPEAGGEEIQRYLGVVDDGYCVCQITIGAFTADDFATTIHPAGVPADYYLTLPTSAEPTAPWRAGAMAGSSAAESGGRALSAAAV